MPDEWEMTYGLDPSSSADADTDIDGDRMTNEQEYAAGTDPHDPNSVMRLDRIAGDGTNFWRVSFVAISNHTYTLQAREFLDSGSFFRNVGDLPATPTNRVIELLQPVGNFTRQQFFRLVTPRQRVDSTRMP